MKIFQPRKVFENPLSPLPSSLMTAKLRIIRGLLISAFIVLSPSLTESASSMPKHIVFSDVDGTLVHYPKNPTDSDSSSDDDALIIRLPPSKTGTRGVLSKRTLELCNELRTGNLSSSPLTPGRDTLVGRTTPLVLISGMRTTTLFQRLPYLPRADAYVSESGGRIFYPVAVDELRSDGQQDGLVDDLVIRPIVNPSNSGLDSSTSHYGLMEDLQWKAQIKDVNAAGPDGFNDTLLPMEQRSGKLWAFAAQLKQQGYVLDTVGYSTAFRINRKMQSAEHIHDNFDTILHQIIQDLPKELGCSTNLGCIDIYPITSGKRNCCEYLLKRFCGDNAQLKTNAYCMCDDDNDVEMATACKIAFLPSVTSESLRSLIQRQQQTAGDGEGEKDNDVMLRYGRLVVTEDLEKGIVESGATERALELIMIELQKDNGDEVS